MNRYALGATVIALTTISVPLNARADDNGAALRTERAVPLAKGTASLDGATSDFNGATEIARGDYRSAELVIVSRLQVAPSAADLLLNLAYVYRHTGRAPEARTLYRAVLSKPDEVVATNGRGSHWAHTLAQAALVSLDGTQLTAR